MIRFAFKFLFPLATILVTGLIGYNYFYGSPAEQENSKQIISKVKGLGADIFQLLSSEKEKLGEGKYDQAISKISSSLNYLKQKASSMAGAGQQFNNALNQLEYEKQELQQQLEYFDASNANGQGNPDSQPGRNFNTTSVDQIQNRINQIARRIEDLDVQMGGQ